MNFIERAGLVQYDRQKLPDRSGVCDLCPPKVTYFDHCHEHGWIRGEVCPSHNGSMKLIDANRNQHLWEPWMLRHWLRCPDCAAARNRELPETPDDSELANLLLHSWRLRR